MKSDTIWDLEKKLEYLACKDPTHYTDLYFTYRDLLRKHLWFLRVMNIVIFISGIVIGFKLGQLWG